jgi:hypothetical protein
MFILDPNFSIPYSGSRVDGILDPDLQKEFKYFNPKPDTWFSKIRTRMFIPDPGS